MRGLGGWKSVVVLVGLLVPSAVFASYTLFDDGTNHWAETAATTPGIDTPGKRITLTYSLVRGGTWALRFKVADTTTTLPSPATEKYSKFDPPEIDGTDVVFVAWDDSTPPKPGVFKANVSNTSSISISTVAHNGTLIPGQDAEGDFISFQSATLDGAKVAFVGNGPKRANAPLPNNPDIRQPGLYTYIGTTLAVEANQDDEVPEPQGPDTPTYDFEFFFTPSYDNGKIAYEGWQERGVGTTSPSLPRFHGIYLHLDICSGPPTPMKIKIINTDDQFDDPDNQGFPDGADILDFHIGREGLDGAPGGPEEVAKVVFYVQFKAALPPNPPGENVRRALFVATIEEDCE